MWVRRTSVMLLMLWLVSVGTTGAAFRNTFNVDKATLADKGSNSYMILDPGHRLVLADGKDTLTITVLAETKMVDGVRTRIVEERETKRGRLAEISRNYFAFDKATGDIYYFGEDVDMYDTKGNVVSHEGGWLSGLNGATFGLMVPGEPKVGDRYYQEMAPAVAMDRAEVVSLAEKGKVPAGTFQGCLKTRESSDLETGVEEKLFAPGIGLLKDGSFRLVRIETPPSHTKVPDPVMKTFTATFPEGRIEKVDAEEENGVTVYDFEFREGRTEKETDITAEGIMLEFTVVVRARNVPRDAMKAVRKAAEGAKIRRIGRVEMTYETRDGRTVKLAAPITQYVVEMTRGDQNAEIVVDPSGVVVESPRWSDAKEK